MTNEQVQQANPADPTINVRSLVHEATEYLDDLQKVEVKRVDEKILSLDDKIDERDDKYQVQFNAAKDAVSIALIAQEKAVAAALDATKEAIGKAEIATDKRFDLLSEKIDGVNDTLNKNAGAQGIYVTHTDLSAEMEKLRTSFEGMLRPVITFMNNSTGKSAGLNAGWVYLLGGLTFISTVMAIVVTIINYAK